MSAPDRFSYDAAGQPTLICVLELNAEQAAALQAWFSQHSAQLKADRWRDWGPAESCVRTILAQVDTYGRRAFTRTPKPATTE